MKRMVICGSVVLVSLWLVGCDAAAPVPVVETALPVAPPLDVEPSPGDTPAATEPSPTATRSPPKRLIPDEELIDMSAEGATFPEVPPPDPADVIAEFPLSESIYELITVPVEIDGREYCFAVDTGATHTVLDTTLARFCGPVVERLRVHEAYESYTTEFYAGPELAVAQIGRTFCKRTFLKDLSIIRATHDSQIYGILGVAQLNKFAIRIDYSRKRLYFVKTGIAHPGREIAMAAPFDDVNVRVTLGNDLLVPFLIDTGAADPHVTEELHSVLSRRQLARTLRDAPIVGQKMMHTSDTMLNGKRAIVERITTASHSFSPMTCQVSTSNILGRRWLSSFATTIDFPRRTVFICPTIRHRDLGEQPFRGFEIERRENEYTIVNVRKGLAAHRAGLRGGEVIVSCNDVPAIALSMSLIDKCSLERKPLVLTVRCPDRSLRTASLLWDDLRNPQE